ncbi:MAG: type IX secretion system membrane protein PorP/SprF, partial [Bacteroidota bacterium]
MTRLLLIGLCLLASINSGNTQEVAFSQFMKNRLLLNPAYAGIEGGLSATVTRREQWGLIGNGSRLPGVFRTQAVTLEGLLGRELKSGWGLYYLDNTEGDANLRTINAGANYVYVLVLPAYSKLNRGAHTRNIRLGGGFYYATKRIDWNRLTFSDQIDPKGPDFFLPQSSQAAFFDDFDDNRPSWLGINFGFVFRQINYDINNNGFQWTLGG